MRAEFSAAAARELKIPSDQYIYHNYLKPHPPLHEALNLAQAILPQSQDRAQDRGLVYQWKENVVRLNQWQLGDIVIFHLVSKTVVFQVIFGAQFERLMS